MAWIQTATTTLTNRDPAFFITVPASIVQAITIFLPDIPETAYQRFGYCYIVSPQTIGGVSVATRFSVGPVWFPIHRLPLPVPSNQSAILFKPSPQCPLPTRLRAAYFTS